MFTGLIEDLGTVVALGQAAGGAARLTVEAHLPEKDLFHGASVAVDGSCLTVVAREGAGAAQRLSFDVSPETLKRTTLGQRRAGDRVNLELPMALGERLGGHLVLGHVDGVGHVISRTQQGEGVRFRVALPPGLSRFVVEKGSIALDGVSLTVNELIGEDDLTLFLIPESLRATTWGARQPGNALNVEVDILAKHVARLLEGSASRYGSGDDSGNAARPGPAGGVDLGLLQRTGFVGGER
jgi:riboflavin synthase